MKIRFPSKPISPDDLQQMIKLKTNMVVSLDKNQYACCCNVFKCICLQVNNKCIDTAIDWTCKYKRKINWNNFVFIDSLPSIYNKNMHWFLANFLWASKKLKERIWVWESEKREEFENLHVFIHVDFVGNNTKMTKSFELNFYI